MNNYKIKNIYIILIAIITYIIQSTILQNIRVLDVIPNLLLIVLFVISMKYGFYKGMLFGVFSGILVDLMISMALGVNLFIYSLLAVLLLFIAKPLFTGNKINIIIIISIGTIIYNLLYALFMYFLNRGIDINKLVKILPIEIIYNSILAIIVYVIWNYILNKGNIKIDNGEI